MKSDRYKKIKKKLRASYNPSHIVNTYIGIIACFPTKNETGKAPGHISSPKSPWFRHECVQQDLRQWYASVKGQKSLYSIKRLQKVTQT